MDGGGNRDGPPPVTQNIALHSRYARQLREGTFEFDMPGRTRYARLALGTMEVPPVQLPLESEWSSIYITEGCRINATLQYLELGDGSRWHVPLSRNPARCERAGPCAIRIVTEYPHGLGQTGRDAARVVGAYSGPLGVVITPTGLSLAEAAALVVESDNTLVATWPEAALTEPAVEKQCDSERASLQTAAIADPTELAAILRALGVPGVTVNSGACVVRDASKNGLGALVNIPAYQWCARVRLAPGSGTLGRIANAYVRATGPFVPVAQNREAQGDKAPPALVIMLDDGQLPIPLNSPSYTLAQLSAYCTACAAMAGVALKFEVSLTPDRRVKIRTEGGVPFGINFMHPLSIDASCLGFRQNIYDGMCEYTGHQEISAPVNTPETDPHALRLQHRINTNASGECIVFEANRRRVPLTKGRLPEGMILPIREGDLVCRGSTGLLHVAPGYPRLEISEKSNNILVMVLGFDEVVEADATFDITVAPDATLTIDALARTAGAPGAIVPELLGLPRDRFSAGSLVGKGCLTRGACQPGPSLTCPSQYAIDHPPYILVTLSGGEISGSCQLAIQENDSEIPVFAKVLFAPYRMERQNPAEIIVPGGKKMPSIVISLLNPDGTPYHTHGVPFSLSLSTVTLHP
jgi:hypothetical protein